MALEGPKGAAVLADAGAKATDIASTKSSSQHLGHASGQSDRSESSQHVSSDADACSQALKRPTVILGVSGSVAAIKVVELAHLLAAFAEVKIVATKAARHFIEEDELPAAVQPIHGDEEEWHAWQNKGDPVLHIDLRKWADLLIIAPLSANSLAKMAQGLCDNCLTSVVRAWDFTKPLLVAPAMNTFMWDSPFTSEHLSKLGKLGVKVIPPVSKALACGDIGTGAMASPVDIATSVQAHLH
ncbi:hypothetical protein WJX77_010998 [Trebouxia sp. C0004]